MSDEFGDRYAHTLAQSQNLTALGGRSVAQALDDGVSPREVWDALCDHMGVPAERRLGIDRPAKTPVADV